MRVILYFDEARVDEARPIMKAAKEEGIKIKWASGYEFTAHDTEILDQVWTLGDFPKVIEAYKALGTPIFAKDGQEAAPEPEPVIDEPEAVEEGEAADDAPSYSSSRKSRKG